MRTGRATTSRLALLVFLVAAAVRLAFAGFPDLTLEERRLNADSPSYFEIAHRLADDGDFMVIQWRGGGPDSGEVVPTAFRPPLWIVAQAIPYAVFGSDPTVGRILNIGLDAAACGALVLLGTRLAGRRVGLIAGVMAAFYPLFITSTRQLMSEPLVMLLVVLLLLACDRYLDEPSTGNAVVVGVVLGLIGLSRPNGLTVAVGLGVWLLWKERARMGVAVRKLAPIALAATVVVGPYVAWASVRAGTFVPVTTQGGVILAGDFTDSMADRSNPRWGWWDITPMLRAMPKVSDEVELDRVTRDEGLRWIGDHPGDTLKILALRVQRYFDLYVDIDGRVKTNLVSERRSLTVGSLIGWWILAPLAVVAFIRLRRRRELERWMPGLVVFITFAVSGVLFGGASRYRVPAEPVVVLLAATALSSWLPAKLPRARSSDAHP